MLTEAKIVLLLVVVVVLAGLLHIGAAGADGDSSCLGGGRLLAADIISSTSY